MKRAALVLALLLSLGALAWSSLQTPLEEAVNFAPEMPHGAILYLQSRDFSALLREWNQSTIKQDWLRSAGFEAFSQSRLFLRLQDAQKQFAAAAGLPADMNFLTQAAGKQSALALYDVGSLEFLYISRIPSAESVQTALWQSRSKFEPRNAGGMPFYVHTDLESHRVVAFAIAHNSLLLATREDLLAGALEAMAGGEEPKLSDEDWFRNAIASTHEPGDLRLVLNLSELVKSPHFRSYWIQRNITELRQYSASISDLYRSGDTYREERVFLRAENAKSGAAAGEPASAPTPLGQQAAAELLASVPAEAGFYRAMANPAPQESLALIVNKLLAPAATVAANSTIAPSVQLTGGETGSSADLETRIDQPAIIATTITNHMAALRQLFEKSAILAQLQVESTRQDPGTSFIHFHSAIVLASTNNWDAEAARAALQSAVSEITTQSLGIGWRPGGKNVNEFFELDGQFPLCVAVRGKYLIVSDQPELLNSISFQPKTTAALDQLKAAAGVNFSLERDHFITLTSLLDHATGTSDTQSDSIPGAPPFFSGNLASLSRTLSGLQSESVIASESDGKVLQTVTYRWLR